MKLRIVVFLGLAAIVSLAPSVALAQGVGGGPKGGVTFSSLSGEFADPDFSNVSFEYGPGFAIGGFVAVPMGNSGLFQPEFGFVFGGGVDFASGLQIDVRYYWGLSNIVKDDSVEVGIVDPSDDFKNRMFAVMAGFSF